MKTFERYQVEKTAEGLKVTLNQTANTLGFLAICAVGVTCFWYFGPYGPSPSMTKHASILFMSFFGLFGLVCIAALVSPERREVTFLHDSVRERKGRRPRTTTIPVSSLKTIKFVTIEHRAKGNPIFRYQVEIINKNDKRVIDNFEFSREYGAKEFSEVIAARLNLPREESEGKRVRFKGYDTKANA